MKYFSCMLYILLLEKYSETTSIQANVFWTQSGYVEFRINLKKVKLWNINFLKSFSFYKNVGLIYAENAITFATNNWKNSGQYIRTFRVITWTLTVKNLNMPSCFAVDTALRANKFCKSSTPRIYYATIYVIYMYYMR